LADLQALQIANRALRDPNVRGDDLARNSLSIILPIRMGLLAVQQNRPWFCFHLHEGRWELQIIQSGEPGGSGRFSSLLHVLRYTDPDNRETETPLTKRAVENLRSFICPASFERVCVTPMAVTTEQRTQGAIDWETVDIIISHTLLTPDNVLRREYDRHLICSKNVDVWRGRDYYISNSGIIPDK
jgi:hypothetical protein